MNPPPADHASGNFYLDLGFYYYVLKYFVIIDHQIIRFKDWSNEDALKGRTTD